LPKYCVAQKQQPGEATSPMRRRATRLDAGEAPCQAQLAAGATKV
jgi:hypothetical protein